MISILKYSGLVKNTGHKHDEGQYKIIWLSSSVKLNIFTQNPRPFIWIPAFAGMTIVKYLTINEVYVIPAQAGIQLVRYQYNRA
ncbi:MAG: hypothetical protein COX19_05750 [Desulfobacterales bacterium CG23_combo_of_CG06-09_8_20_14_all_51_8]|nr:MAG: hypothetical protein COX19_05750 [Desulfobacterales bacterium CG23_combo_of_CG06-09_8_20_14_all_51_8]